MNREFNLIQRFLRGGKDRVRLNATWQKLYDEEGIGVLTGGTLVFSPSDRASLVDWFKGKTGINPLVQGSIQGDRIDVAEISTNEKLSTNAVFSGEVRVAARQGVEILTINGPALTPPGSSLVIDIASLILNGTSIIIVENGAVMRRINELVMAPTHVNSVFVYRGHNSDAEAVSKMVASNMDVEFIGFYDFDPAGLMMAIETGLDELVLPTFTDEMLKAGILEKFNQPNKFWEQSAIFERLKRKAPDTLKEILSLMAKYELAIMQEHLIAHNIPVSCHNIKTGAVV